MKIILRLKGSDRLGDFFPNTNYTIDYLIKENGIFSVVVGSSSLPLKYFKIQNLKEINLIIKETT